MDLNQIIAFIKTNEEFLKGLQKETSDIISDTKAALVEENKRRADEFVAKLGEKMNVTSGEERLQALNLAISGLERERDGAEKPLRKIQINNDLATLLQVRANVGMAAGFNEVVAFSDEERNEIARLLNQAEDDIAARKNLKTAIDITVRLISVAAKIAAKGGSFGIA